METTWRILIITIAGTLAAGIISGIFIGKILVKRARTPRRRLLSTKERIAYSACVILGAALILLGVFYKFPSPESTGQDDMIIIDGETPEGETVIPEFGVAEAGGVAVAKF